MPDVRRADLHLHTTCSDGALSPTALVALAKAKGLHAIAITDHDTLDGIAEAQAAGKAHHVEVIPGVELSVTVDTTEIHLLAYFFDVGHRGLQQHLAAFREGRRERVRRMVGELQRLNIPLTFEMVERRAQGGLLARPHVAQALLDIGAVETYPDAFDRYLRDGGPAFVPKPLFPAAEALAMVHDAGGIGVLAHPGHWTSDRTTMALIRAGLDGIETIHPSHDDMLTMYYRKIVRDFALIETGGSDYHGTYADEEERLGRYSISYPVLERARRAIPAAIT